MRVLIYWSEKLFLFYFFFALFLGFVLWRMFAFFLFCVAVFFTGEGVSVCVLCVVSQLRHYFDLPALKARSDTSWRTEARQNYKQHDSLHQDGPHELVEPERIVW